MKKKHIHRIDKKWAQKTGVGECFCGERFELKSKTTYTLPRGVKYGKAPASLTSKGNPK